MGWFGPSTNEEWRRFSEQIGAEFAYGGIWKGSKVRARVGTFTTTLDTYTISRGRSRIKFTRIRAPFRNPVGFRFSIYRKGVFSELGKLLGMQDIEVGEPAFDEAFIVKSSDEWIVRDLLSCPKLRRLFLAQPKLHLQVKDDEGWYGTRFPEDVDLIQFQELGVIKDVDRLRSLFELFAAVLDRLCRLGVANKEEPGVLL